jgi:hypothetical protein
MASEKKTPEKHDSEMLRRFKSNPFIFIGTFVVLVIVVIAFVLVPAIVPNSGGGMMGDLTFGYYDNIPISYVPGNYFAQYYALAMNNRQDSDGDYNSANYRAWRESFEAAAIHTAILQEMKKAGYKAPTKVVDREVAKLFQENGRFSSALYNQVDENRRLALWRQEQENLTKRHFISDANGLLKPTAEAKFVGNMAVLERTFEMVFFSLDAYPDAEYEAYAREHSDLFRSVRLSSITVNSSKREAERILASIKNRETTFEDAARAYSTDSYADRGGDMGIKMAHELEIDIPDAAEREKAIALARDEFSDVITTTDGWSFFRGEEAVQEADISDAVTMEKVRSRMRNFDRGRMENWALDQASAFIALANEYGLEEAVYLQRLERRSFGPIPINYGGFDLFAALPTQTVAELSGAATNEYFWRIAFTTPINNLSQPVVQGNNILVLYPTAETEADEYGIEGITSTFETYWLDYITEQSVPQYFFSSPKMVDNFFDVFLRYLMNQQAE